MCRHRTGSPFSWDPQPLGRDWATQGRPTTSVCPSWLQMHLEWAPWERGEGRPPPALGASLAGAAATRELWESSPRPQGPTGLALDVVAPAWLCLVNCRRSLARREWPSHPELFYPGRWSSQPAPGPQLRQEVHGIIQVTASDTPGGTCPAAAHPSHLLCPH